MKRFFALMLVVCMLLSAAAFAEAKVVMQDEMPPMVVTSVNASGEVVVARVCDANGNVLAEVKEDGSLQLTDVHFRSLAADAAVAGRLTAAYEGVMADVHHSDVECKLHDEHVVKVDINDLLAALPYGMDAHDLVMYELYDVALYGDAALALSQAEGNYAELTFELKEYQWLPLVVLYTADGQEWQILNHEDGANNRFTVKLPANGTIALLIDGRGAMSVGEKRVYSYEEYIPGVPGIDIPDDNANFTPSVSGKPAPGIVVVDGADGETIVGYFYSDTSDLSVAVPDRNYIVVTAVSERDYLADIQTHEHLEWAYDSILKAKNVGELFTEHDMSETFADNEHATIAAQLDEILAKQGTGLTYDQLVVKDLFEVTAYGDYVDYLYDPANYLEITFDANLGSSKLLGVLHSADSVHWHVHPAEDYTVSANGHVTLKMYDLGIVAFLVEAEEVINVATAVQSPD